MKHIVVLLPRTRQVLKEGLHTPHMRPGVLSSRSLPPPLQGKEVGQLSEKAFAGSHKVRHSGAVATDTLLGAPLVAGRCRLLSILGQQRHRLLHNRHRLPPRLLQRVHLGKGVGQEALQHWPPLQAWQRPLLPRRDTTGNGLRAVGSALLLLLSCVQSRLRLCCRISPELLLEGFSICVRKRAASNIPRHVRDSRVQLGGRRLSSAHVCSSCS
mmetsp:Transcript_2268/g.6754  ORF Transcript_2268/g.6754 Transcript_2268/m.6754 type:complete len:213 (-) Transcript_2268:318-956(-)